MNTKIISHKSILGGGDLEDWMEHGVTFEVAEALLGSLVGLCSDRVRAERQKASPDPKVIARWKQRQAEYTEQRRNLYTIHGPTLIDMIKVYGEEVRSFSEDHGNAQSAPI